MTHKNIFKLALLLAFAITTVWYTAGATYSHQRPISEPDALVYLQYARNMAEGHPFEYVQGDAPTTGCTSYLYPIDHMPRDFPGKWTLGIFGLKEQRTKSIKQKASEFFQEATEELTEEYKESLK